MDRPIRTVVILGGGSAGFLTALALKAKLPQLEVTVVRSTSIPIIGVGEATTAWIPWFLHEYIGLDRQRFYDETQPSWKLGIRFIWGSVQPGSFNYPFDIGLTTRLGPRLKNTGYYCLDSTRKASLYNHLMDQGKSPCFKNKQGDFLIDEKFGYHIENRSFVSYLEQQAKAARIQILDKIFTTPEIAENGFVKALNFADSTTILGDLFIDCSGFKSVLLGSILQEPFVSYANSLFCDSAITGSWQRKDSIFPFTTAETMENGWCWRIDLRDRVNRGYVYASAFMDDAQAAVELQAKNPLLELDGKIVRFKSGRYQRSWVNNVMAIGNASGFVEPLESTGLHMIGEAAKMLCDVLLDSDQNPSSSLIQLANRALASKWDDIKNFLAIHFKFNQRVSSDFWRYCWDQVELGSGQGLVDFWLENGPSALAQAYLPQESVFGLNGYYNLLIDQGVKPQIQPIFSAEEQKNWQQILSQLEGVAQQALTLEEAFAVIRDRRGQWLVPK